MSSWTSTPRSYKGPQRQRRRPASTLGKRAKLILILISDSLEAIQNKNCSLWRLKSSLGGSAILPWLRAKIRAMDYA